jgi:hypothetical protein
LWKQQQQQRGQVEGLWGGDQPVTRGMMQQQQQEAVVVKQLKKTMMRGQICH